MNIKYFAIAMKDLPKKKFNKFKASPKFTWRFSLTLIEELILERLLLLYRVSPKKWCISFKWL